jgi:multimeric flavodoxin WrbA
MKVIILNGSPRKGWNTDLMLKEAQKGAESMGAEIEYIDLYNLKIIPVAGPALHARSRTVRTMAIVLLMMI